MSYLSSGAQKCLAAFSFSSVTIGPQDLAVIPGAQLPPHRRFPAAALVAVFILFLGGFRSATAQSATVNWSNVHQVIDGFGASDAFQNGSMSSANQSFFFGTGSGQLGLSVLRVEVTSNSPSAPGDCSSVSASCAGSYVGDMQAAMANGARVYASPWSPPAQYTTNGSVNCQSGGGGGSLSTSSYGAYATWLSNYVQSLKSQGINLYAISVQNEPDMCMSYDSAVWSAADIDTFVKSNLGPTFAAQGLSTQIFAPEASAYSATVGLGSSCGSDSSCNQYIGGINWHEYGSSFNNTSSIGANPYPSGWPTGKKYWETEASCGNGFGPSFCESGFNTDITDALDWGAIVDQRIAVDGANAWLYWWLIERNPSDDEALSDGGSNIPKRAYMLGQYAKFVRPGYYRIDATHQPQQGVSISAYRDTGTNTIVIVATNYNNSSVSQQFSLTNAPQFSSVTPTTTSASLSLAAQASVSVSKDAFTYTLPANSITTFVGKSAAGPSPPVNLTGTVMQ
jgi:glucuronoarabinoxylan endo-1,4-beta-xylanase